jgi:uncharacterized protein YukE
MATEVKQQLDLLREMKPDGESLLAAAEYWYTASGKIQDSVEYLDASWYTLDVNWNGDGYDSFEKYMRFNVSKVADSNRDLLFDIGNAIVDLYNDAVQAYNEAVQQMGTVLEKASGIDIEKSEGALLMLLTQFVNNFIQRRQTLTKALASKQGKITVIAGQVQQFRRPGEFPKDIINKDKWTHDPS